jgi:serine/threonine-protein kinase
MSRRTHRSSYEVITGRPAVDAKSILEAIQQVTECEPPKPRSLNPKIDKDLEQVCLKCLRKVPQDRYVAD